MRLELKLPFPPSVNHYWRHVPAGRYTRTIMSAAGRKFREQAMIAARLGLPRGFRTYSGPVLVSVVLHPPDKRKRDLDNHVKALLDAMTHSGIWLDDSQVKGLALAWGEAGGNGFAHVEVEEYRAAPDNVNVWPLLWLEKGGRKWNKGSGILNGQFNAVSA